MATPHSERLVSRRRLSVEEALDHAEEIARTDGLGAVTVSEIARRMGMKGPSLYKYFPSRNAIYDGLFARGNRQLTHHVLASVAHLPPGLDRLLTASEVFLRWSHEHQPLAQLMFWRPVPGFVPSPEAFAPSQALWDDMRTNLTAAVAAGDLVRSADSEEAMRLLSVVMSGVVSQQLSNEPEASFDAGRFTSMTHTALALFTDHYRRS